MPVNLASVKGCQKAKGIQVEWNTELESNTDRYEVERSATGQQFTKAGSAAAENSNIAVNYNWFDANPLTGNNFYRIKAIEKTGVVKYSEIIKVAITNKDNGISFYPNPATGNAVNVALTNMAKVTYTINIITTWVNW